MNSPEFATTAQFWPPPLGSNRNEACPCGSSQRADRCHPFGSSIGTKHCVPLPKEGGLHAWTAVIIERALQSALDDHFTGWLEYSDPIPVKTPEGEIIFRLYWVRHDGEKPETTTFERSTFIDCRQLVEIDQRRRDDNHSA